MSIKMTWRWTLLGALVGYFILHPMTMIAATYMTKSGLGETHPIPDFTFIETMISFSLPSSETVTVTVYNVNGQKVKTVAASRFPAGNNHVVWDSTSESGDICASGLYFFHIRAGEIVKTGKMLLLR